METLSSEFTAAVTNVTVRGDKLRRAIAAHLEVRAVLELSVQLRKWGIDTLLIGSYARHTARYPGKDVDVFARFPSLDLNADPASVYNAVADVLIRHYGDRDADPAGRVTKQARSLKIAFTDPDEPDSDLSFSVDVVPAVPWGEHWGIPNRDVDQWSAAPDTRWVQTSPIKFQDDTEGLSTSSGSPTLGGDNAYCPTVRLIRQIRHFHLGDSRPGGLYTEIAAYNAWRDSQVTGDSWAELLSGTLREVGAGFRVAAASGMTDPILGTALRPALEPQQWLSAAVAFEGLAQLAATALASERCMAAKIWRQILGTNDRGSVLPLPNGCDDGGFPITSIAAVTESGSDEPRGFA